MSVFFPAPSRPSMTTSRPTDRHPVRARALLRPISRTLSQVAANPGCSGRSWIRSTCTQSTASDSAVSCGAWKASAARPTTVT